MAKIPITVWAERHFDEPVPKRERLQRWARNGWIVPPPVKVGNEWRVEPDARYIPADDPVYGEIIHGTKSKKAREQTAA